MRLERHGLTISHRRQELGAGVWRVTRMDGRHVLNQNNEPLHTRRTYEFYL